MKTQTYQNKRGHGRKTAPLGDLMIELFMRVIDLQMNKFPKGTVDSLLKHLAKEVKEARRKPGDPHEWGDMLILYFGSAWRQGHNPWDLVRFALEKMAINEKREWPAEPDRNGIYHHTKCPTDRLARTKKARVNP